MSGGEGLAGRVMEHSRELVELCQQLIRCPSPNPPGEVSAVAEIICGFLENAGVPYEWVEAEKGKPNLIARVQGERERPHLVLNGHMDTQPAPDPSRWAHGVYSGHVESGKIYGLGVGNMKGGVAALLMAVSVLAERQADLPGRLTLALVSDECSFGPAGARYLVENRPDLLGDAFLGAEPTSPEAISFGEKGLVWIKLTTRGLGGHSSFVRRGQSAIVRMAKLIDGVDALNEWKSPLPPAVQETLDANPPAAGSLYSDPALLSAVTANVGNVSGGHKINMIANECQAWADIRLPFGVSAQETRRFLDELTRDQSDTSMEVLHAWDANWTDPDDPVIQALMKAVELVRGKRPYFTIRLPASDARLFRLKGCPSVLLGPEAFNQNRENEHILLKDLVDCAAIYAVTAWEYLASLHLAR